MGVSHLDSEGCGALLCVPDFFHQLLTAGDTDIPLIPPPKTLQLPEPVLRQEAIK
jgi:hypothetical protein